jgi:hypothetical protein
LIKHYDISEWVTQDWNKPPKGSRAQSIFEDPANAGDLYYFKQSKNTFPSEIWAEIIASKIGQMIGFNVLNYDLATYNNKLGCLSKSMNKKSEGETLYHGVDILNDYLEEFEISDKPTYSFQNLQKLCSQNLIFKHFIDNFVEIILLDALIGNTDRHTENWAFIQKLKFESKPIEIKQNKNIFNTIIRVAKFLITKEIKLNSQLTIKSEYFFSPIYDSGSCLGREIAEEKIPNFIKDKVRIDAYIKKGKSEIFWQDKRLNFFEIAENVQKELPNLVKSKAEKLFNEITLEKIGTLVQNADSCFLGETIVTHLSQERKDLIQTLLIARLKLLKQTIKIDS